jgi:hypothetical protein
MAELADLLGVPLYSAVGLLELLWHFTSCYTPRGDIGRFPNKALARACRWTRGADKLISAFIEAGWIDTDDLYRLVVHDWADHADRSTQLRVSRAKDAFIETGPSQPKVYFIQSETNQIKIGFTRCTVTSRLEALQVGSPHKLSVVGFVPGTKSLERTIQRRFQHLRCVGEWFTASKELVDFIGETVQSVRTADVLPEVLSSPLPSLSHKPEPIAIADGNGWARFEREYTGEVIPDRDCHVWFSTITTPADEALLFENLPDWLNSRKFRDGFAPAAQRFLFEGHWKTKPRPDRKQESKSDRAMRELEEQDAERERLQKASPANPRPASV